MKRSQIWLLLILLAACGKTPVHQTSEWKYYRKGYYFLNKNIDSAFFYLNEGATASSDKEEASLCYRVMASIQSDAGDNYGAQESLIQSLDALDEHKQTDRDQLATDYDELGLTFLNLGNVDQALPYFRLALHYVKDPKTRSYFLNHSGNAYQNKRQFFQALKLYDAALKSCGKDTMARARILTNITVTRWMQNKHYNAAPGLIATLNTRLRNGDRWGVVSSYGHLATFYEKKQPDSARFYAEKMLQVSEKLKSSDEELLALQRLIPLSDLSKSRVYFRRYQQLNDSIQQKRNAAKNQFALIRYNVQKAKTENLQLQKTNEERQYQLISVTILAILGAVAGFLIYKKRKRRLRLEADRRLQDSKLQLSQKVHDKVANGIYRIMSAVEHQPDLEREHLLDQLEGMYDISRNIAHDEPDLAADFAQRIDMMLFAFRRPSIKLAVSGNDTGLWEQVNAGVREQLTLILQELMVNMTKHSQATQAYIAFSLADKELHIEYRDNGIGLSGPKESGMGMQNTVSRIKALNGSISFDSKAADGLRAFIQLPII